MDKGWTDILIVGGGIAGLSTAMHLAQRGAKCHLVDRESLPGFYASGHNAGIGRQLTGRPEHTALTVEGSRRLRSLGLQDTRGGELLGAEEEGTAALRAEAEAFGVEVLAGQGSPVPGLRAVEHLAIPSDGVIDVDGLLHHCIRSAREAGARLDYGCAILDIEPGPQGFRVATDQGTLQARRLVNAAGAWAQELGRWAGGLDIPFHPYRRHLIWSPTPWPSQGPWVWWADRNLYLRPESGGLLLCACEEALIPLPTRGLQPPSDGTILETLAGLLRDLAPELANVSIGRYWAGLRTFAPDRRFVVGPDPRNPRLFWVAGLGGHGMTSGLAVGELAARVLLGEGEAGEVGPGRLAMAAEGEVPCPAPGR